MNQSLQEKAMTAKRTLPDKDIVPLLVQSLIKSGLFLQRELSQICQPYGLNTNQFSVLHEIVFQGPISQKELCARLLFEKSNLSKIVNTLQMKGLITVIVAPQDRRMTMLSETAKGAQLSDECLQRISRSSVDLLADLSAEEIHNTLKIIKKLEKSFRRTAAK